jgi:hypothetical protein
LFFLFPFSLSSNTGSDCVQINNTIGHEKRSILEQQIKTKRLQAPHIRASDLQIMRSDGNKDGVLAYNGNAIQLFIGNPLAFLLLRISQSGGAHT